MNAEKKAPKPKRKTKSRGPRKGGQFLVLDPRTMTPEEMFKAIQEAVKKKDKA